MDPVDWQQVCESGREMQAEAAEAAEAALARDPEDLTTRVKLIGYYWLRIFSPADKARIAAHLHWLISHRPEIDLVRFQIRWPQISLRDYEEARRRWLAAVEAQPANPTVLRNASRYLFLEDPEIAKELIVRGIALAPSAEWHKAMVMIHQVRAMSCVTPLERYELAMLITAECERALAFEDSSPDRYGLYMDLARSAADSGDVAKAREAAVHLLEEEVGPQARHVPRLHRHWANIVLGKVALLTGDLGAARGYLAASLATPVDFRNFVLSRPDLTLAGALLARGEGDAVLRYLEALEPMWDENAAGVRAWRDRIARGEPVDLDEFHRHEQERAEKIRAMLRERERGP